jgi:transposase
VTASMPAPVARRKVIVEVDTHKHVHVAVAIDVWGVRLEDRSFPADSGGYRQLIGWAVGLGPRSKRSGSRCRRSRNSLGL